MSVFCARLRAVICYDTLALNFLSAIVLAAITAFRMGMSQPSNHLNSALHRFEAARFPSSALLASPCKHIAGERIA
jgi:hypothetical protein